MQTLPNIAWPKGYEGVAISGYLGDRAIECIIRASKKENKPVFDPLHKAFKEFILTYRSYGGTLHVPRKSLLSYDMVVGFAEPFCGCEYATRINRQIIQSAKTSAVIFPFEPDLSFAHLFLKCEVGSESAVALLLAQGLLENTTLPSEVKDFLDQIDTGFLSGESSVGEEEIEALCRHMRRSENKAIVVGVDSYTHPQADVIAQMLALIDRFSDTSVLLAPPHPNSYGIIYRCDPLDRYRSPVLGVEAYGDSFFATFHPDPNYRLCFDPAQKRLLADGTSETYEMAQSYCEGLQADELLGRCEGVSDISVPPLGDKTDGLIEPEELPLFEGVTVYSYPACTPEESGYVYASKQCATALKLQGGETIRFQIGAIECVRVFKIDTTLKGIVARNPIGTKELSLSLLSSYRFCRLEYEHCEASPSERALICPVETTVRAEHEES